MTNAPYPSTSHCVGFPRPCIRGSPTSSNKANNDFSISRVWLRRVGGNLEACVTGKGGFVVLLPRTILYPGHMAVCLLVLYCFIKGTVGANEDSADFPGNVQEEN